MKNRRFSDTKIMGILRQVEGGVPVTELCRKHCSCVLCVPDALPTLRVVRSLNRIIEWRGKPQFIRVNNAPE